MFAPKELPAPIEVDFRGQKVTVTHTWRKLHIDPEKGERALTVMNMQGVLVDGRPVARGEFTFKEMDAQGLADMIMDTTGGRKAGEFSTGDIDAAIAKREAEKANRGVMGK